MSIHCHLFLILMQISDMIFLFLVSIIFMIHKDNLKLINLKKFFNFADNISDKYQNFMILWFYRRFLEKYNISNDRKVITFKWKIQKFF